MMPDFSFQDTEYRQSNNRQMECIMACAIDKDLPVGSGTWRLYIPAEREGYIAYIQQLKKPICCWSAEAEARTMDSLGIDIRKLQWFDGMTAYKLLTNGNSTYKHHYSLTETCRKYGVPYTMDKVLHVSAILDGTWMNDAEAIATYCMSDVEALQNLIPRIWRDCENKSIAESTVRYHSKWVAYLALVSRNGIPVDNTQLTDLCQQADRLTSQIIYKCNTTIFPFYDCDGEGVYHFRRKRFLRYLRSQGLEKTWPRTESGDFSTEEDTLKMRGDKIIRNFLEIRTLITQLRWFYGEPNSDWKMHCGEDFCLRPYFNPNGTLTGRNAPPSRQFIPAMSSWLRCLIRPPESYAIVGIDWGSQEYAIAAVISKDQAMMRSYISRDPYYDFGVQAGAIPTTLPEGKIKADYKPVRNLFKAITLGLQYGMGAPSLAHHIAVETGIKCTVLEARRYIQLHKATYHAYWEYLRQLRNKVAEYPNLPIILKDSWLLWPEGVKQNTVGNFPIQGSGATILKIAVMKALDVGLDVIFPLHDAIYIICPEDKVLEQTELLKNIMRNAANIVLENKIDVRLDVSIHKRDEYWVEEKGCGYFEYFAPLLGWKYKIEKDLDGKSHYKRR